jgi:6-pyruvoyltetrahydropterin/6-carboxytetrahydropterin synthase
MLIKKEYRFYAGHRNQDLKDRCSRHHGHLYRLFCFFNVKRHGSITTLFGDFDNKIEPFLKNKLDHRTFIDINDNLYQTYQWHKKTFNEDLGEIPFPFPSSVENVSFYIFDAITNLDIKLDKIELQETVTSTLIYEYADYIADMESELGDKLIKFKEKYL